MFYDVGSKVVPARPVIIGKEKCFRGSVSGTVVGIEKGDVYVVWDNGQETNLVLEDLMSAEHFNMSRIVSRIKRSQAAKRRYL